MQKVIIMAVAILSVLAPLAAGTLTVTSPNGGERLARSSAGQITWTASGVTDNVKLILLREDNSIYGVIVRDRAPGGSPYPWTVGQTEVGLAPAGRYKIRVSTMDGGTKDTSDAAFEITEGGSPEPSDEMSITVTSPNGGESWPQLSPHPITWSSRGLTEGRAVISLSKDGAYVGSIGVAPDVRTGTFSWNVGNYVGGCAPEGGGYRVHVQHLSGTEVYGDFSDGYFTIAPAPGGGSHDFIVSDPVMEERADGKKGFRVTVTDRGADFNGTLILQHYCMAMGLGNAVKQRMVLNLRRNVPATVSLFNLLPQYFQGKCDVLFRFDVNPDHAVAESDYANNVIQRSFCWERWDGRLFSLRLGRNYTATCPECSVVIRPADVESVDGDNVRFRLEIVVQNCGREPIQRATVRVVHHWYYRDANNRFQQGDAPLDAVEVSDMGQGHLRILNRTVTMRRLPGSTLSVYFGTGESGALDENNHISIHPNFVGF